MAIGELTDTSNQPAYNDGSELRMNYPHPGFASVAAERGNMKSWFKLLGVLLPILGLVCLFYFYSLGWCWGWLKSDSRMLRYPLQCNCPATSEEARYPENVDVLVLACTPNAVKSERLAHLQAEGYRGSYSIVDYWILEQRKGTGNAEFTYWLVNVKSNQEIPLEHIVLEEGAPIPPELKAWLQTAGGVYLSYPVVVLQEPSDPAQGTSFALEQKGKDILALYYKLTGAGVKPIDPDSEVQGAYSLNRVFRYRYGIFLTSNNQLISPSHDLESDFWFRGWAADNRGVMFEGKEIFVIGTNDSVLMPLGFYPIPQPVLLLKIPKEYLSPPVRAQVEAQEAQERQAKQQGNLQVGLALGLCIGLAFVTVAWWVLILLQRA